jgi:hypothetical protein
MAKKQLDQIFADKLGKHEMQPSPKAWERIAKNAGIPEQKKRRYGGLWLLLLSFSAMGGLYWAWHAQPAEATWGQQQSTVAPVSETAPVKEALSEAASASVAPAPSPEASAAPIAKPREEAPSAQKEKPARLPKQAISKATIAENKAVELAKADDKEATSVIFEPFVHAQRVKAYPHPMRAKPKKMLAYRYRVEITIPYVPKTSRTSEPRGMMRKVMRNVLAD